jgi:hypothetical protein
MPTHDASATAALAATVRQPAFFGWVDFVGDPIRATTWGQDVPFAGTGDADLDGYTFSAVDPRFIEIGEAVNQEGGSDSLTLVLSGIAVVDAATMAIINDRTKWYLRTVRLWKREHDETLAPQGAVVPYYTGYMTACEIVPRPDGSSIQIRVENYHALFSNASNRDYLSQSEFDSADQSARATIGAANSASMGPAAGIARPGAGGGGASDGFWPELPMLDRP